MNDDLTKIAPAFVAACAALQAATKNATNAHLGNSYADLESVQTAARDALAPNGLAWFQEVIREDNRIGVHTRIIHTSGQILDCGRCLITVPAGSKNLAHSEGSSLSYARRYGLAAAGGIHQADPDASPSEAPPRRVAAPKAPRTSAKDTQWQVDRTERMNKMDPDKDPDLSLLDLTVAQVDRWLGKRKKGDTWESLTPTRRKNAIKWLADPADAVRGE